MILTKDPIVVLHHQIPPNQTLSAHFCPLLGHQKHRTAQLGHSFPPTGNGIWLQEGRNQQVTFRFTFHEHEAPAALITGLICVSSCKIWTTRIYPPRTEAHGASSSALCPPHISQQEVKPHQSERDALFNLRTASSSHPPLFITVMEHVSHQICCFKMYFCVQKVPQSTEASTVTSIILRGKNVGSTTTLHRAGCPTILNNLQKRVNHSD